MSSVPSTLRMVIRFAGVDLLLIVDCFSFAISCCCWLQQQMQASLERHLHHASSFSQRPADGSRELVRVSSPSLDLRQFRTSLTVFMGVIVCPPCRFHRVSHLEAYFADTSYSSLLLLSTLARFLVKETRLQRCLSQDQGSTFSSRSC